MGAGNIAQELDARLAVVVSHSGASALAMSKRRNMVPIVGVSDRVETLRQMTLYWNVIPLPGVPTSDSIQLLQYVEEWGQREGSGCRRFRGAGGRRGAGLARAQHGPRSRKWARDKRRVLRGNRISGVSCVELN